jgi:hypothetical protein
VRVEENSMALRNLQLRSGTPEGMVIISKQMKVKCILKSTLMGEWEKKTTNFVLTELNKMGNILRIVVGLER